MRAILVAAAFLTRMPLHVAATDIDVGTAARWFPLVGAAIGGAAALISWVMRDVFGLPAALTATLLTGFGAWVTGAIHLDGLADTADGFGGGRTREEVLRIMRDPVIGSYGASALFVALSTRVAALTALLERGAALPFLVTAPAISRWTISMLASWLPFARAEGGLGQAVMRQRPMTLLISTSVTALIASAVLGFDSALAWVPALLTAAGLARVARRRIGGATGDVFGASVELTEIAVLLSGVVMTGRV